MTFLPIVEILQGDLTGYIPTNLVSMTDGQLYFSTALFNKGFKPAIDFGLSVSRIGNKAQWPAMKALSKSLRLDYLQYKELLQMTQLRTTGLSKEAQSRLRRGEAINQLITQIKNEPVSFEKQVIYLYALSAGLLDTLSEEQVRRFRDGILAYVDTHCPEYSVRLRETKEMSEDIKGKLDGAVREYIKGLMQ